MTNLFSLFPAPAYSGGTVVADQRITVADTAVGTTAYTQIEVQLVTLDVQTADVMCTFDTSDPTTSNGHRLAAGTNYTWSRTMFNAAKFIRATATSAAIHASPLST